MKAEIIQFKPIGTDLPKKVLASKLLRIYDGLTIKLSALEFQDSVLFEGVAVDMVMFEDLLNELNGFRH